VTPAPFSVTTIGSSNLGRFAGLDFQPGTNTLFASSGPSGPNPDSLFTLDPNTGAATLVGAVGTTFGVADLAIDNSGTIFGHDFTSLYRIDPNTGAGTIVGGIPDLIEGLAVDPTTDTLYGLGPFGGELFAISKLTGASAFVGSFGAPGASGSNQWNGFGIDDKGNFYGSVGGGGGEIFALHPSDFSTSLVGDAFNGSVSDIAFSRVPEPASATLCLLGLGGLMLRRRRTA
jgi:PEP-CTERM motif